MKLSIRITAAIICACAVVMVSVFIGSADIPFTDFLQAWWVPATSRTIDQDLALTIYGSIRLPRIFLAAVCGAALGGAGVISQGLFRNSLASPSIVGTTMGASLAAVLVYYFIGPWSHWLTLPLAAFAGAMLATLTVFGLAQRFVPEVMRPASAARRTAAFASETLSPSVDASSEYVQVADSKRGRVSARVVRRS